MIGTLHVFFFILNLCPLRDRWRLSSWKTAWYVARHVDARQMAEAYINHYLLVSPMRDIPHTSSSVGGGIVEH